MVLLLLLPRMSLRNTPGPKLPSRLLGLADDCRRLVMKAVAVRRLLDVRLTKPLPFSASAIDDGPGLDMMLSPSELVLVFLDRLEVGLRAATGSGSERGGIGDSISNSLPRAGSGDA